MIAEDSFYLTVGTALQNDPTFNSAVDIVGNHYNCGYLNAMTSCSITSAATGLNKPLWESEQGSQPFDTGAAPLARAFNRGYIDARMTAAINWSLIWSVYSPLPFHGDGLMLADQPWSGNYTVGQSIWVAAHTTQFTQPGWHYIDSASGYFGGNRSNGSYVTLKSTNN